MLISVVCVLANPTPPKAVKSLSSGAEAATTTNATIDVSLEGDGKSSNISGKPFVVSKRKDYFLKKVLIAAAPSAGVDPEVLKAAFPLFTPNLPIAHDNY